MNKPDSKDSVDRARQILPLSRLMQLEGYGKQTDPKTKLCPFCEKKSSWKFEEKGGRQKFHCFNDGCVAHDTGGDEIGFLSLIHKIDRKEAFKLYLQKAGVWEEPPQKATYPAEEDKEQPQEEEQVAPEVSNDTEEADNIVVFPSDTALIDSPKQSTPPPKKPQGQQPPPGDQKTNPWHALWSKLILNAKDRETLKAKRGFTDKTIDELGFKSSNKTNFSALNALADEFPMEELIDCGIYTTDKKTKTPKPNPQFTGWGMTGQKDDKGKEIWANTEPILIPYFDDQKIVFYLRPHKGGVRRGYEDDESCGSHSYCPWLISSNPENFDGLLVITEGEYKAAALWQCGIPAIAVPGISIYRNYYFRKELIDLLHYFSATDIVIAFDNEVKDNPDFKSRYKPDPWDRYDTQVWAEYIARDLAKEFPSALIAHLPDEWRVDGKADWDGALAQFVSQAQSVEKGTQKARTEFIKVVKHAFKPNDYNDIFPTEAQRIIKCKLGRFFHTPRLPRGGDDELKLAKKFTTVDPALSKAFHAVQGKYYVRKLPGPKQSESLSESISLLQSRIADLEKAREWQKLREVKTILAAKYERLKGMPEEKSDFYLTCHFKRFTEANKAYRIVTIRNISGQKKENILIDSADLAQLSKFREWCYATGVGAWCGGQKELEDLVIDMDHYSSYRDIYEIQRYGFHEASKLWFFGDVAFAPDGREIKPDPYNIFWHEGLGYQVDANADEAGTGFVQGSPTLLSPPVGKDRELDLKATFKEVLDLLYDAAGSYEAWLALGVVFGYAVGPEFLKKYRGHPGLWISGEMGVGKNTFVGWLMRMWGFPDHVRVRIGGTKVGINRALSQYSFLPLWFDEFRRSEVDDKVLEVLRGAFDRSGSPKGMMDGGSNRVNMAAPHTTPIITGESSPGDPATRSRYANFVYKRKKEPTDEAKREAFKQEQKDLIDKINNLCNHFQQFGRHIMRNRQKLVDSVMESMDMWLENPEVQAKIKTDRIRLVTGMAYTVLESLIGLFGLNEPRLGEFAQWAINYGTRAGDDVEEYKFVSEFWNDLITGVNRGKIDKNFFKIRPCTIENDVKLRVIESGYRSEGTFQVMFLDHRSVFADYLNDLRSQGKPAKLDIADIRRDIENKDYWIAPAQKGQGHTQSFNNQKRKCWAIRLDKHPFGSDFEEALSDSKDAKNQNDSGSLLDD